MAYRKDVMNEIEGTGHANLVLPKIVKDELSQRWEVAGPAGSCTYPHIGELREGFEMQIPLFEHFPQPHRCCLRCLYFYNIRHSKYEYVIDLLGRNFRKENFYLVIIFSTPPEKIYFHWNQHISNAYMHTYLIIWSLYKIESTTWGFSCRGVYYKGKGVAISCISTGKTIRQKTH